MSVAGAPAPRQDHAAAALRMAERMLSLVADWRAEHGVELEARIGVASGPIVGGVIGDRRIVFDVWGDTVNLASRMESQGVAGRIQMAESTRLLLGNTIRLEARQIEVKGLGQTSAYLVSSAHEPR